MILNTKVGGCRGHGDVKEWVMSKMRDAMGDTRDPWQQGQDGGEHEEPAGLGSG